MIPSFLIEETTVRESGESSVFDVREHLDRNILLTFGVTHAVERESIKVDVFGSKDGSSWCEKPLVSFSPKSYCGTYELTLPLCEARYLKAAWSVKRWSRVEDQPFFRFYLAAQPARPQRATAGAA